MNAFIILFTAKTLRRKEDEILFAYGERRIANHEIHEKTRKYRFAIKRSKVKDKVKKGCFSNENASRIFLNLNLNLI